MLVDLLTRSIAICKRRPSISLTSVPADADETERELDELTSTLGLG